jgi:hypothetical protein
MPSKLRPKLSYANVVAGPRRSCLTNPEWTKSATPTAGRSRAESARQRLVARHDAQLRPVLLRLQNRRLPQR